MSWISGKNVIITGVSTGIGKDMAKLFVNKYGCKVLGIARSVGKLEALKQELGDKFSFYPMDISKKENWEEFASTVAADFAPDIMINNAGMIHPFANICALTDSEVEKTINTNYISLVHAARTMIPVLQKSATPGYVNVSSASALLPVAGESIYSSTKAAAYALSEVIRQEYQGQGWYVGYVLPGPVKTDIYGNKEHGGADQRAKVADNLIANVGLSSEAAARIIVRRISHKRHRIIVGGIARLMGWFHAITPGAGIGFCGKLMRIVPLNTFKGIFAGEKEILAKRKARRKALKKSK